jgi:hypothetical protein
LRCESIVKKFSFYIFFERSFVIGSFAHKMLSPRMRVQIVETIGKRN